MSALSSNAKIDPLILLRRAISGRTDIHLLSSQNAKVFTLSEATALALPTPAGRVSIPKTLTTRYRKPGTPSDASPVAAPEHFYDSQSILCCYLNREKGFAAYIQEAQQQGCAFVSATERKLITDFLEGKNAAEPASVVAFELGQALYHNFGPATAGAKPSAGTGGTGGLWGEANGVSVSVAVDGASPAKRARYAVDKQDQELVKRIMQLHEPRQVADRRTVLRGNKAVNFENARTLVLDRIKVSKEDLRARQSGGGASLVKPVGVPGSGSASAKRRPMNPIIVISPSSSALITMHNVKRFLEDAVFEPPNSSRGSGAQITATEDVVMVNHRRGYTTSQSVLPPHSAAGSATKSKSGSDRAARYIVVDGIEALNKFGDDAWDRVVCVMTTGQEWQFRPYKWSDPKELFHHVKGFFIQWTHDPPNPKVRSWNVTEIRIDESKRHIDKSAAADFWRSLEAWIALHKPFVAY
ncbi:hypothetical protein CROQUDRAFT_716081 [Cronartium quercuum f. sp. fusiforme G11]|uniref:Cell division control protein 73 C-terminal domain-containing protein n=1 Tax=Cronartium quercuum f. sp. fusiforme G11 TaxID=708437 RepID=A0A9P6NEU2_9BASI|nr:hypothetical protein CROQUDRAFT_716081 [Cronartium quercuum f. sp. fusiforme G11]